MEMKKRFHKQELNKDDNKGMKVAAKALKGSVGALCAIGLVVLNKDKLKAIGKNVVTVATKAIEK